MSSFLFDGLALLCGCLFPSFRRPAPGAARNAVPDLACEGERMPMLRLSLSAALDCIRYGGVGPPPALSLFLSRVPSDFRTRDFDRI